MDIQDFRKLVNDSPIKDKLNEAVRKGQPFLCGKF